MNVKMSKCGWGDSKSAYIIKSGNGSDNDSDPARDVTTHRREWMESEVGR